jgi:hypothetical protein
MLKSFPEIILRQNKWNIKKIDFIMKCLLLLALIALFFKAYVVEADIRLLAFYPHLPDQDPSYNFAF